jgi:hypothetical protein
MEVKYTGKPDPAQFNPEDASHSTFLLVLNPKYLNKSLTYTLMNFISTIACTLQRIVKLKIFNCKSFAIQKSKIQPRLLHTWRSCCLRQATTSLALASDSTASTSAPKNYEEENVALIILHQKVYF